MSQIETTVKQMEAGEAIAWLEDHIENLKFSIREMGEDAADVSKELLAECRRLLNNAKNRQRYAGDPEYRKKVYEYNRKWQMKWAKEHPEEYKERNRQAVRKWMKAHPDKKAEMNAKYLADNPEYHREYRRRLYCCEDLASIENYDLAKADDFKGWHIHHRLESHKYKDRSRTEWVMRDESVPRRELIALGLYYDRPAKELVYMRSGEHRRLHRELRKGGAA